ncbi:efflux RND transporter periplasmic adaptor subunit [Candidatus Thalassolituus haligoni]|jgi:membrane fusion protein (multidrug efflux system)|uniref:efflux RND transporter periplasmic adaptor subunit n=1 Tax=Candidatus Thalassolituus haligoni TaxID=3100113 RepID=UPI003514E88E|tara:strand:+ start:6354 stop:7529 length:1176 start_codon:yes stop_codon:yes gene_type:complete
MKHLPLVVGALIVGGLLSGCQQEPNSSSRAEMTPEVSVITVSTAKVVLTRELKGRTTASMAAEIRPQVGGIIKERLFKEGSDVSKGQVLYQIDPASYQATYNEAKADLRSAESSVQSAQLKDQRYTELAKIEGISQQDADDAHATYMDAVASIDKYKAALESARISLEYTGLKAPIAGRIGISSVTPGALVSASQDTALATIRALDPIYVDMAQSSTDLLALRKTLARNGVDSGSAEVSLILEDGSRYDHKGQLRVREVSVDESTGSVTLRAEFPNPDGLLLPGMFVRAEINEAVDNQAILVPQQGIAHDNQGNAVALVVTAGHQVEKRFVETERSIGNQWLISSGLEAGDQLIVEGSSKVAAGSTVKTVAAMVNEDGSIKLGLTSRSSGQ